MKKYISLLVGIALATTMSCEVLDMDVQEDPNALTPEQFNIDAFLNSMQIDVADFFNRTSEFGMEVTRMKHLFGPLYNNAYQPASFDATWTVAYAGILQDASVLIPEAEEREFYKHAAMAKIMQSYVLVTLVDYFGDIPFTEAIQGVENLNPGLSKGEDVYAEALRLLDDAIEDLGRESFGSPQDLYYNRDFAKWEALANTLKMRIHINTKHVDPTAGQKVAAILETGKILDQYSPNRAQNEDFQFRYGTNRAAPDSRHPNFTQNYITGGSDYMSNYLMNRMLFEKGFADPRMRYYFFRQNTSTGAQNAQTKPCVTQTRPPHFGAGDIFCQLPGGYWGRDHADADGIPPDGLSRTLWGLYPFGGQWDNNQGGRGRETGSNSGAQGAGVSPIMLVNYVYFLRAEAALTMGTGEEARELLEQGIRLNMEKVINFNQEIGHTLPTSTRIPTQEDIDAYVKTVMDNYDAGSAEEQLQIVMEEYYLALFGNGVEAYNAYRRTGYPDDLQPTLDPNPGPFIYSFIYPSVLVNRNVNVNQKPFATPSRVFWDPGITLR